MIDRMESPFSALSTLLAGSLLLTLMLSACSDDASPAQESGGAGGKSDQGAGSGNAGAPELAAGTGGESDASNGGTSGSGGDGGGAGESCVGPTATGDCTGNLKA